MTTEQKAHVELAKQGLVDVRDVDYLAVAPRPVQAEQLTTPWGRFSIE